LAGIKVIEMAAIGPVPFCGMMLADMGAEVVRIDRVTPSGLGVEVPPRFACMARSKQSVAVDVKSPEGLTIAKRLLTAADVVIEGFRPGVMERLGLGPDACAAANPKLVFGRCSGWGDEGPMAGMAAHDINYIGMSGALAAMGREGDPPAPPLNLVGDFGGAAMQLVTGILAAIIAARATGKGQVVKTSIAQGAIGLMPMIYGLYAAGRWSLTRASNPLDGGAPFYRCYACSDGRYVAVGAIERKFYLELLDRLDLAHRIDATKQNDSTTWPATAEIIAARFKERPRDAWTALFDQSDACVTPVLDMGEAPRHPQQIGAGGFVDVAGLVQPAPSPRFSETPLSKPRPAPLFGAQTGDVLEKLGFSAEEIAGLAARGVVKLAELE
jgi:alpha-methylacyl-CoA racemase